MDKLHVIGQRHGTDKHSHSYKGVSFLDMYEPYIQHKREEEVNILDIGILKGGSLKTWKEYFPKSNVIGLDINPGCSVYTEERIEVFIGSQTDVSIKTAIEEKYKTLDLIVDDGSHINELTFKTFNLYWPLLKDGGTYIIEDTHCCYANLESVGKGWPGMSYNSIETEYNNIKNDSFDRFSLMLIRMVCRGPGEETSYITCDNIYNLSFFPNTLVISKK